MADVATAKLARSERQSLLRVAGRYCQALDNDVENMSVSKLKLHILLEASELILYTCIIGERAKRARHSQVCSIENRGYIYIYIIYSTCKFCSVKKAERNFEIAA